MNQLNSHLSLDRLPDISWYRGLCLELKEIAQNNSNNPPKVEEDDFYNRSWSDFPLSSPAPLEMLLEADNDTSLKPVVWKDIDLNIGTGFEWAEKLPQLITEGFWIRFYYDKILRSIDDRCKILIKRETKKRDRDIHDYMSFLNDPSSNKADTEALVQEAQEHCKERILYIGRRVGLLKNLVEDFLDISLQNNNAPWFNIKFNKWCEDQVDEKMQSGYTKEELGKAFSTLEWMGQTYARDTLIDTTVIREIESVIQTLTVCWKIYKDHSISSALASMQITLAKIQGDRTSQLEKAHKWLRIVSENLIDIRTPSFYINIMKTRKKVGALTGLKWAFNFLKPTIKSEK